MIILQYKLIGSELIWSMYIFAKTHFYIYVCTFLCVYRHPSVLLVYAPSPKSKTFLCTKQMRHLFNIYFSITSVYHISFIALTIALTVHLLTVYIALHLFRCTFVHSNTLPFFFVYFERLPVGYYSSNNIRFIIIFFAT